MLNYVNWGPPGCGKSHTVEQDVAKLIADNPHLRVYYKTIQKWWDGYGWRNRRTFIRIVLKIFKYNITNIINFYTIGKPCVDFFLLIF